MLWNFGMVRTVSKDHPLIVERIHPRSDTDGARRRERGFKLHLHERDPSAPLSPFYFDFQGSDIPEAQGLPTFEVVDLAARCMIGTGLAAQVQCRAMVGVPPEGNPFAKRFAELSGVPYFELERLDVSRARSIISLKDDVPTSVQKVLVVNDVITSGASTVDTVMALRVEGIEVTDVMAFIDRDQGARDKLADVDCKLHAVFTTADLFTIYSRERKIQGRLRNKIKDYLDRVRA
jgi:hypothetical protein